VLNLIVRETRVSSDTINFRHGGKWSLIRFVTTPFFDMTELNGRDRFHLLMDAIDGLPQTGGKGGYLKQPLNDKLNEHKQYINKHGQDMSAIRS